MSHFVPLKPSSLPKANAAGPGFVPKILPRNHDASIVSGGGGHGSGGSATHSDAAQGSGSSSGASHSGQAQVEFQRDGDRIIGISITCSCGQTHNFDCVYPSA